jgi:hypothetical protein
VVAVTDRKGGAQILLDQQDRQAFAGPMGLIASAW